MSIPLHRSLASALAALLLGSASGSSTPGAKTPPSAIVLGMSTALSGPAADLGNRMRDGVAAALAEVERGGGRSIRLITRDDGYEPDRAGPNVRELVEQEHVLAIVGNVGTPTAVSALQVTNASGTPFYGAFTGAGLLRKSPPDHWVVNFRASYAEETKAMVDALIEQAGLSCEQIACFTQRDAYGDAGYAGALQALKSHGLKEASRVLHVRYERNTLAVEAALGALMLAEPAPRAVIMVGAYLPCAAFIKLARENEIDATFLNVSFVGSSSLLRELGPQGDGVIITQVVPHFDSDLPIVAEYRAALRAYDGALQPDFVSLEGYISTRILCRALASIEGTPDRESLIRALEALGSFDIGLGTPLALSAEQHQACHRVWPTILRGGSIVPFEWSALKQGR
jgi:ABC-type branched-subunit amino acid transport system substrate-binding protein